MGRLYSLIALGAATAAFATSNTNAAVAETAAATAELKLISGEGSDSNKLTATAQGPIVEDMRERENKLTVSASNENTEGDSSMNPGTSDSAMAAQHEMMGGSNDQTMGNNANAKESQGTGNSPIFAMRSIPEMQEMPTAQVQASASGKNLDIKGASLTSCRQEEIKVPSVCYKDETFKKPYICSKPKETTVCKKVNVEVPSTCERTVEVPCAVQYQERCVDVAKVCERMDTVEEEYVCKKESCKTVLKSVPDTCYKKVKKMQDVACTKRVCENVSKKPEKESTEMRKLSKKPRECTKQQCSMVRDTRECTRTVMKDEEYECSKTDYQKVCKDEPVEIPSICRKTVTEKRAKICTKTEEKESCKNVMVRVPGVCTKTVLVDETYDCGTECKEEQRSQDAIKCKGKACKLRRLHESKNCGPKTCTRSVKKEEPYKCEKTEHVKECQMVPKQVSGICYEDVSVEKPYPCKQSTTKSKCEMVPTTVSATCKRTVPERESYPCGGPDRRVCVNVPVPCETEVRMVNECRDVPATCKEHVEVQEAYECSKKVKSEECTPEKICKRKIAVPVKYDCVENVCTNVARNNPVGCTPGAKTTEKYDCAKTVTREQCEPKTVNVKDTCYQTITKPVPYKCTQVQLKTICDYEPEPKVSRTNSQG